MSININAFKWNFLQTFGIQGLNFVVSVVLARILGPEEFGIVALAMVFISIGQTVMNGGLAESVIRLKAPTNKDYNSLFFLNLVFALVIYFLFFVLKGFFADFLGETQLNKIIPILSLLLIFNAFSIVQGTKLNRELNFKKQFWINVPSTIVSSLFGLYFAYNDYGVFSLIYMQLIYTLLATSVLYLSSKYIPSFRLDFNNIYFHLKFGLPLTLNNLIGAISKNANSFILGKYFSVVDLGLYNRAQSLKNLPINNFMNIADKNLLPIYANNSSNMDYLSRLYSKVMELIFLIFIPISVFLILNAEILVEILLGEKWLGSVIIFQILLISAPFEIATRSSLTVLKVTGSSKIILKIDSFFNLLFILFAILSIYLGLYFLFVLITILSILKYVAFHLRVTKLLTIQLRSVYSGKIFPIFITIISIFFILFFLNNKYLSILISSLTFFILFLYFLISRTSRNSIMNYFKTF